MSKKVKQQREQASLPPYRFSHACHDPAHCGTAGLFTSFKRGTRTGENNVGRKWGANTIKFKCPEPLGALDLRVLQGLIALGAPLAKPDLLTNSPEHHELQKNLMVHPATRELPSLVVTATYYQLATEIGITRHSGQSYDAIRASIKRMWGVSISVIDSKGMCHGYKMLSRYTADNECKRVHVALNPRLTEAILGERAGGTGSHTRIMMSEVRNLGPGSDVARILHQYLCAIVGPGEEKRLQASNLCAHIWLPPPNLPKSDLDLTKQEKKDLKDRERDRLNKQNQRLDEAMVKLSQIGWKCEKIADQPKNRAQAAYRLWKITRPTLKNVEIDEFAPKSVVPTIPTPQRTPAAALRELAETLDDEQFASCVARQPIAALKHCLARLTDVQFATCVKAAPAAALRYATDRLKDWQVNDCARAAPLEAINFAAAKLSPERFLGCLTATTEMPPAVTIEQLDAWLLAEPTRAWNFVAHRHAPNTPPTEALRYALEWLTPKQFAAVAGAMPAGALKYASANLGPAQLDDCALAAPTEALQFAAPLLSPERLVACIKETGMSPQGTLTQGQLTAWANDNLAAVYEHIGSMRVFAAQLPGHFSKIVAQHPSIALREVPELLTTEQLNHCASLSPRAALEHAAALLPQTTLANCVAAEPAYALAYARETLPDELFQLALASIEAISNSKSALDSMAWNTPGAAALIASKLTPAQIEHCVEKAPAAMLKHAYDHLSLVQIQSCKSRVTQ